MAQGKSRPRINAAIGVVAVLAAGLSFGGGTEKAAADDTNLGVKAAMEKVGDARVDLARPMPADSVYDLAKRATKSEPIEVVFRSGEWTGGLILDGTSPHTLKVIREFLGKSRAARGSAPIVALSGSERTVAGKQLQAYAGKRTKRSTGIESRTVGPTPFPAREGSPAALPPCEDCNITVNGASNDPGVPSSGTLLQLRQQGVVERTDHTLRGFSNKGYPAVLHIVGMTQGHGGYIKPRYIYEHDYKVKNNGYVSTSSAYSWETNLPGAYKDTRARGLDGGDTDLDFTVGSVYTWLLDGTKTYTISTLAAPGTSVLSSTARLTASVIPNDGGFSKSDAAVRNGCTFTVDPYNYPGAGSTTPKGVNGDLAWCGGIGDFVHPSYVKNISLISLQPFTVKYDRTCRNWKPGSGYTNC